MILSRVTNTHHGIKTKALTLLSPSDAVAWFLNTKVDTGLSHGKWCFKSHLFACNKSLIDEDAIYLSLLLTSTKNNLTKLKSVLGEKFIHLRWLSCDWVILVNFRRWNKGKIIRKYMIILVLKMKRRIRHDLCDLKIWESKHH